MAGRRGDDPHDGGNRTQAHIEVCPAGGLRRCRAAMQRMTAYAQQTTKPRQGTAKLRQGTVSPTTAGASTAQTRVVDETYNPRMHALLVEQVVEEPAEDVRMRGKDPPEDEVVLQIGEDHALVLPARGAGRNPIGGCSAPRASWCGPASHHGAARSATQPRSCVRNWLSCRARSRNGRGSRRRGRSPGGR